MKVIIIEDEVLAAKRLQSMLVELDPTIQVIKVLDSIEETVQWMNDFPHPDLIFMDIMLADGQSFEIFEQTEINEPVVFTTAYDEYAIKAFQVNSVDYLLKPIELEHLERALKKHASLSLASGNIKQIFDSLMINNYKTSEQKSSYKKRFLVKTGDKYIPISIAEVTYFTFTDKLTFLHTKAQKRYMLDFTLDVLETLVDPHLFFRLNRQCIASFTSIQSVHTFFNGKLKVYVVPEIPDGVVVSKEKAQGLKAWLNR